MLGLDKESGTLARKGRHSRLRTQFIGYWEANSDMKKIVC